ncbi:MAG: ROK family transcriptional regulator [Prevotella sp.]
MAPMLLNDLLGGTKSAMTHKRIIAYYLNNSTSTIPELSKELNLSVPTIAKVIAEMCEDGYIVNCGKMDTGKGRSPVIYGLAPDSGYFVGVDLMSNGLNLGLMNFKGELVKLDMDVPYQYRNSQEGLDELCGHVTDFIEQLDIAKERILNVGVNIPGRVNPEMGHSFSRFNFEERPLVDLMAERIGCRVYIDNDTRAMTYGEMSKGVVKGEKDVIFVNLSWGIGCGLILNGELYTGKSGFSGEFGHFPSFDNEVLCHCGKRGCLETEISGMALHRNLLQSVKDGRQTLLAEQIMKDEASLTLDDIIDATLKEDLLCIELVEDIGQKLGRYLAGLINLLNPEMVIIGGSLARTGDSILQPVKSAVRKYSLNMVNRDSAIVLSKLQGKAGVTGACLLARKSLFHFG